MVELLRTVRRRLMHHDCKEVWGCVDCYHGRPCVDRELLRAAGRDLAVRSGGDPAEFGGDGCRTRP